MHAHPDYPGLVVWEGDKFLPPGMPFPTHYRRGYYGDLVPMCDRMRYRHGDAVQKKQSTGPLTVVSIEFFQFRSFPPEPIYVLSDGSRVRDHQLH